MVCENIFTAPQRRNAPTVGNGACSHKIEYVTILGDYKSQRTSKSHNWFKSYGNFAEKGNFSYWTKS